jgi:FkbM family methyltransferase
MRTRIKKIFKLLGYDIHRLNNQKNVQLDNPTIGNMQIFLQYLRARGFNPQSILDVGANVGGWSRIAKSIFPTANCFLIEPQIEMKPFLDGFCQEFPGSQWFLAGAGANPGELTLTIWDDLLGSSFLPPESEKLQKENKQRRIPIITIDSLIETGAITTPQLVKLDIQGFEIEALRGGKKLFINTEIFILEVSLFIFSGHSLFHEVITFMADRGYLVYDFVGFARRPYDGALGQVDVCFVKHNSFLRKHDKVW